MVLPVMLTALAMIIVMLPMALSYGEGGEQNAPLGRAVIGGLAVATFVTLFVVPVVYSLLRTKLPTKHVLEERFLAEERGARTRKALYDELGGGQVRKGSHRPALEPRHPTNRK